MNVSFQVEGLVELLRRLKEFPPAVERRIVKAALRRSTALATRAVKAATYSTVQRRTGLLRSGVATRMVKAYQGPGVFAAGVYAKKGTASVLRQISNMNKVRRASGQAVKDIQVPFYWKFHEFGTVKMKARPYVARAFQSVTEGMLATFRDEVAKGIDREFQKLGG